MNYHIQDKARLPRRYAALTTGVWALAFVAFLAGLGTISVGSTTELVVRIVIAIGGVSAAAILFRAAMRFDETDREVDANPMAQEGRKDTSDVVPFERNARAA